MLHYSSLIVIAAVLISISPTATANSYTDMLTTPPQGYIASSPSPIVKADIPILKYDKHITTSSPVVTSNHHKYIAWKNAQNNNNSFSLHDDIQNIIHLLSLTALMRLTYEIYRYR